MQSGKALIIYGPRRVGKTTLLKNFLKRTCLKYKFDSGDNITTQHILSSQDFPKFFSYVEGYELLVLDEAQEIPNIGMGIKIIVDNIPDIKIIATGSSSFDLSHQIGEPLTGRKHTLTLYPIAQLEMETIYNKHELREKLEDFLIFGSYPEIITSNTRRTKIMLLTELVQSYLLKDILALEKVKSSKILLDLLKLLAFQVGQEVSYNELANHLRIDIKTVIRYLDLLVKTFVIMPLYGFSRNLRSEITKKNKYYFLDNGIRNGVISQFNELKVRNDTGQLFENFVCMERLKKKAYENIYGNTYFWRTYEQQEIDLIEEIDAKLCGYEIKWSGTKKVKAPKQWKIHYPESLFSVITPDNYLGFVC